MNASPAQLPAARPPPRAVGDLPAPATPLIGRRREVREVAARLAEGLAVLG